MDSGTLTNRLSAAISQQGGPLLAWLTARDVGEGRQQRVVALLTRSMFRVRGRAADAPSGPCEDRVRLALIGDGVLVDPERDAPGRRRNLVEHWLSVLWAAGCEEPSDTYARIVLPEVDRVLARVTVKHGLETDTAKFAAARVLLLIATRDRAELHALTHASSKLSRAVFALVTGAAPGDIDGWLRAAGEGARIDAEEAAAAAEEEARRHAAAAAHAAAHAAAKDARAQDRVDAKLEKIYRTKYGDVPMRELIDRDVAGGAHFLIPERDGKATTWWLRDADGSGISLSSKIEGEYAAAAIERRTGVPTPLPALPPMIVVTQRIGQWDLAKPVDTFFPHGAISRPYRVVRITAQGAPETQKEAAKFADNAAAVAERAGITVLERGVVVYDSARGHKAYASVLVLRDPVA